MRGAARWRRGAALLAVCAVLAAGCDGDADGADPPPATESTSTTTEPTDPTTSSGPVEPTLPAAAEGSSVAAAKAFVGYYIEVLDYALTTGEVDLLSDESAPTCSGCRDYIRFITDLYGRGGWRRGGDWLVESARLSGRPARTLVMSLIVKSAAYDLKKSSVAGVIHYQADRFGISLVVMRKAQAWRISDLFAA